MWVTDCLRHSHHCVGQGASEANSLTYPFLIQLMKSTLNFMKVIVIYLVFGICDLSIAYVKLYQFLFRFDRPFFWSAAGLNLLIPMQIWFSETLYIHHRRHMLVQPFVHV